MQRAPKQWCLTKTETIVSFESWRQNLVYTLSLDANFAQFLVAGVTWGKKTKADPLRGLKDDPTSVPDASRRTAAQKLNHLELMLGQIANFCPIISRNTIVKNSTSIDGIWQTIRLHFGFQSTGGHFLDFAEIHLEPDERPEDLYQRLTAFIEDNLLTKDNGISHHDEKIEEDEEISPTLENMIVLTWLRLIHSELPKIVKQRYGTELRSRTLASIKPEISQALGSLLDEIQTNEAAKVMRTAASTKPKFSGFRAQGEYRNSVQSKICPLCKQAGRSEYGHFLSKCKFLPEKDRHYMVKARQIVGLLECDDIDGPNGHQSIPEPSDMAFSSPNAYDSVGDFEPTSQRVQVRQSPYLDTFYDHYNARITIDSGATGNMISLSAVKRFGVEIRKSSQSAHQADGSSPLNVVGETKLTFTRDNVPLLFEGLVIENLDVDILAGTPFMEHNDITIRPAKRHVILNNGSRYVYGSCDKASERHAVRTCSIIRAPHRPTTVWPGEFLEVETPPDFPADSDYALEPKADQRLSPKPWPPPAIVSSVAGKIRIPNTTDEPKILKKGEHFCQIRPVFIPETEPIPVRATATRPSITQPKAVKHSASVKLDPDNVLSHDIIAKFRSTLNEYDSVFDPNFKGYNGASGPFEARVNMGPTQPPQRKGRLPQYARDQLLELQDKFDDLEELGVFMRPEDISIDVEYLNPSFLVKKPNGGFRLVTAFTDVGRYSKPQPSLMPDVDSTLRQIAKWKYIITTDLSSAFYQIPLSRDSMKYCGVCTPFRGVRVYVRSAMGMPGSETALEELMSRVVGHLIQEGILAKIADDLYIGGDTPEELLLNFRKFLHVLHINNLALSAPKTVIAPKNTTILGWIWSLGTLRASPHRIATLSNCSIPEKVKELRSFIGAYKVLARVIPGCAIALSPLDEAAAGRESKEKVKWTEQLRDAFNNAQKTLASNRVITLPRADDLLWIVTDGAFRNPGLGATMYITRSGKPHLAGFFSAKLRDRQSTWLPCEVEALSIAAAIKHFSPYIIQSKQKACVLTDSKPCVQAYEKLARGEFSVSPRVSTFLATASRYQVSIRHVSGSSILQSDFASRNAPPCHDSACQICTFIRQTEESVVRRVPVTISDIMSGQAKLPFTSRSSWLSLQSECADLRRTHAHLKQGTRPSKKLTNAKDVKRYLNAVTIAKDGLLVVPQNEPLAPTRERIVVPRQVLDGLLTALHVQLDHPTTYQLKQVVHRYFYALDLDKAIEKVALGCHLCTSLRTAPRMRIDQSTSEPPETVGTSFAGDVIRQNKQFILVLRECVTSYTTSCLLDNERHESLRDGLIRLCIETRPLDGPHAVIRTDPGPGFQALVNDKQLSNHRITLEIGRIKNVNKNPVAEKAVQELELELLKRNPSGGYVSAKTLAVATATLNARIRSRGLSAREMLFQRDQFTNKQIQVSDDSLIQTQNAKRHENHPFSEKSKCPTVSIVREPYHFDVGDLVYLYTDRNKSAARDRYIVTSLDGKWCNIRKLVGSQFRNTSYRVKNSECYKVPCQTPPSNVIDHKFESERSVDCEDDYEPAIVDSTPMASLSQSDIRPLPTIPVVQSQPQPPEIPEEIADSTLTQTEEPASPSPDAVTHSEPSRRSCRDRKQTIFFGNPVPSSVIT